MILSLKPTARSKKRKIITPATKNNQITTYRHIRSKIMNVVLLSKLKHKKTISVQKTVALPEATPSPFGCASLHPPSLTLGLRSAAKLAPPMAQRHFATSNYYNLTEQFISTSSNFLKTYLLRTIKTVSSKFLFSVPSYQIFWLFFSSFLFFLF